MARQDVVVIGGGPAGYGAASRLARAGAAVTLVAGGGIGGTCLHRGCIPTKVLAATAATMDAVRRAGGFGVVTSAPRLDLPRVMARKEEVVTGLAGGLRQLLRGIGVRIVEGEGRLVSDRQVEVLAGDEVVDRLEGGHIIIATGSMPAVPPWAETSPGLAISSDEALNPPDVPSRLVVVGGGVLGVEFACIYAAFGSEVVVLEQLPRLLAGVDEEIARRAALAFRRAGITVHTGVTGEKVTGDGAEKVVRARSPSGEAVSFTADRVLLATGRRPCYRGLEAVLPRISHGARGLKVSGGMRTSLPGVYAAGDVVGRVYVASVAAAEGLVAAHNILKRADAPEQEMDYTGVPACVFSRPEVGSVGLTEEDARRQGYRVRVSRYPYAVNGRARAWGEAEGLLKLVADLDTGHLLGGHMVGPGAVEIIHEVTLALKARCRAEEVAAVVHGHPTLSEGIAEAAHDLAGHPVHLPGVAVARRPAR